MSNSHCPSLQMMLAREKRQPQGDPLTALWDIKSWYLTWQSCDLLPFSDVISVCSSNSLGTGSTFLLVLS